MIPVPEYLKIDDYHDMCVCVKRIFFFFFIFYHFRPIHESADKVQYLYENENFFKFILFTIFFQILNNFLQAVNRSRIQNNEPLMRARTACKFLMARKFDLDRSLMLYKSHETIRFREGLVKFDPLKDPLKHELETGKFTILVSIYRYNVYIHSTINQFHFTFSFIHMCCPRF